MNKFKLKMENQKPQKVESPRSSVEGGELITETTVWKQRDARSQSHPAAYDLQMNNMQVLNKTGETNSPNVITTGSNQTMKVETNANIIQMKPEANFFLTGVNVEAQQKPISLQ